MAENLRRTMKRTLVLAVLAALVVTGSHSSAGPGVSTGFYADANWFLKTKNPNVLRWYTASVMGGSASTEVSFAHVASGRCRVKRNSASRYLGCVGLEIAYSRDKDVFEMDAAMQTADLTLKDRNGKTHTVSWQAKMAPPWVWDLQEQCAAGVAGTVVVVRGATAVGRIAGKRLAEPATWEGYDGTELSRIVGVDACAAERSPEPGSMLRRTFWLD